MSNPGTNRTVHAPDYWNHEPSTTAVPLSVNLAPDEDVEWIWAYSGDGIQRRVTGYTIVKKPKQES